MKQLLAIDTARAEEIEFERNPPCPECKQEIRLPSHRAWGARRMFKAFLQDGSEVLVDVRRPGKPWEDFDPETHALLLEFMSRGLTTLHGGEGWLSNFEIAASSTQELVTDPETRAQPSSHHEPKTTLHQQHEGRGL